MADDLLAPLNPEAFDQAHARHLLVRSGFGGSPAMVRRWVAQGLEASVMEAVYGPEGESAAEDTPFETDPDIIKPLTAEEQRELAAARREQDQAVLTRFERMRNEAQRQDRLQMRRVEQWWLGRMLQTPYPLLEQMTLLWHGHFTSSFRVVRDSHMMFEQNRLFREHAFRFDRLLAAMMTNPALLRYLDNHRNVRSRPNENLARELLELFTLGEGNYTESDIRQTARALTGFGINDHHFRFFPRLHDDQPKTVLGRTEAFDGHRLVPLLLEQPACRRLVAWKLYRTFVEDVPLRQTPASADAVINALAGEIGRWSFDLQPVLTRLFASRAFYDGSRRGRLIRSPVHLVAGLARTVQPGERNRSLLVDQMGAMGQRLFDPPTVAGWEGGRLWVNTSTLFLRQNTAAYLIEGQPRLLGRRGANASPVNPALLLGQQRPASLLDALPVMLEALLPAVDLLRPEDRRVLEEFCQARPEPSPANLRRLMVLITALPEFQLT